jgi:hypothetical protein
MKHLFTILLAFTVLAGYSQKKHVYYDTVKTVKERVDFSPDTIPVYFQELLIHPENAIENRLVTIWVQGYVVWQTYRKQANSGITFFNGDNTVYITQDYYTRPYEETPSQEGIFLYSDRKTHVKNKVLISIKR